MPTRSIANELPRNNGRAPRSGRTRGRRRRSNVSIQINGRWQDIPAGRPQNPDTLAALQQQLAECPAPTFRIGNISVLSDEDRFGLLSLIAGASGYTVTVGTDERAFNNLFDAVLHCLDEQAGAQGYERQRRAAVEAAALCQAKHRADLRVLREARDSAFFRRAAVFNVCL